MILFEFLPQQQREHNCGYQKPRAIQKGKNPLCDSCRHTLFALHSFLTSCSCYACFVFVLTVYPPRHFLRRRLTAGLLPESVCSLFAARLRSSRPACCSIVRKYFILFHLYKIIAVFLCVAFRYAKQRLSVHRQIDTSARASALR